MRIVVDVARFYGSALLQPGEQPPEGAAAHPDAADSDRQRVHFPREEQSVCTISVPSGQIERDFEEYVAANRKAGREPEHRTLAEYVAFHVRQTLSLGHHSVDVIGVEADHPEVHEELCRRYGVDGRHPQPVEAERLHPQEEERQMRAHLATLAPPSVSAPAPRTEEE